MRPHSPLMALALIVLSSCGGSSPTSPSQGAGDYSGTVTIAFLASSVSGPNTCGVAPEAPASQSRTMTVAVNISGGALTIVLPTSLYFVMDGPDQTVFKGQLTGVSFEASPTDLLGGASYACAGGSTAAVATRSTLSGSFAAGFTALNARESEAVTFPDGTVAITSYDWKASLASGALPSSVTATTR